MAFSFSLTKKTGSTAANTLTSTATTTSGNFLVLVANFYNGNTPNAPTDSFGNTWTALTGSPKAAGGNTNIYAWYSQNATTGASHTFTLTTSAIDTYCFSVIGLTGRATSSAIDVQVTPTAETTDTTTHTGPSITPTVSGDDIVVAFADNNGSSVGSSDSWTAGASLTLPSGGYNSDGRDQPTVGVMYQENVGTSAVGTGFTSGSSTQAGFFAIAVKSGTAVATLSSPTPSGTIGTTTTATLCATTTQGTAGSNNIYGVWSTSNSFSGVSATQVKAGQNASGSTSGVSNSGAVAVTSTSPTISVTGLSASTTYYYALVQNNANGDSNVVTGSFTTAAATRSTAITLVDNSSAAVASTSIDWFLSSTWSGNPVASGTTSTNGSGALLITGLSQAAGSYFLFYKSHADANLGAFRQVVVS